MGTTFTTPYIRSGQYIDQSSKHELQIQESLGQGATAAGAGLAALQAEAAAKAGNAHIAHLAVLANAGPHGLRAAVPGYTMMAVQRFLDNPDNKKYTYEEFESMQSPNHLVEKQSIEQFRKLRGITDVKRMDAGSFGDITFVVKNHKIQAEMKVAYQKTTKSLIPSFQCRCYTNYNALAKCANRVSLFIVAIPGVTVADKRYGHFLMIPTRTCAGAPNILPDHEDGNHENLQFKFDRSKRSLLLHNSYKTHKTHTFANWAELLVLVPGQEMKPENIEKLVNWSSRPLVALDCSPPTSMKIRETVIQSDDDEPLADGPPVLKRRRHICDEDD